MWLRRQNTAVRSVHAGWVAPAVLAFFAGITGCGGDGDDQPGLADAGADSDVGRGTGIDGGAPADAGEDGGLADSRVPDAGQEPLGPVVVDADAVAPPDVLSAFRFFRGRDGKFMYNDRVVAYELSTPLFSDYTLKERALYVPPGAAIPYSRVGTFEFPIGSALIKTFLLAPDLRVPEAGRVAIETRVLIRHADGWRAYPYLWREDGSDADYYVRGKVQALTFVDPFGQERTAQYLVPQKNQCLDCHELKDEADARFTAIIGPRARYLNRERTYPDGDENQLARLARLGLLVGLPDLSEVPTAFEWATMSSTVGLDFATVERAARDYLDINCAHCHRPNAIQGITSRLFLNHDSQDSFHLGFCKEPGSAGSAANGRKYNIVPGDAEASILVYRTETEEVGDMMPLLGRSLRDVVGANVVRGWVDGLPPDDCQ